MANISIQNNGDLCEAYLATPSGSGKYPCLVLIEEIWGVNDHIRDVADRFAKEGFIVIAPELLPHGMLEKMTREVNLKLFDPKTRNDMQPILREAMTPMQQPEFATNTIAKLRACVDYLIAHAHSNGKIGSIGFCFGGTYSLQLAINDARLDACVMFYGRTPALLDVVQTISCPVLDIYGENDTNVADTIPALETAMKQYGKELEVIMYPGVGHAFFNDTNPFAYNEHTAHEAWQKATAFLHKHLEM